MSKVLLIEDEPFMVMLIEDKLKRAGLEVVALRETVGALEVAKRERPDLIILDWMMPELSGLELCRMLKADPLLSPIPVFMLTARVREEDEKKGLECGASRFITKPFSPRALLEMVLEELGRDRGREP